MNAKYLGTMVKFKIAGPNGLHRVAGIVKKILDDGRLEVKTQNNGYHVVTESELLK